MDVPSGQHQFDAPPFEPKRHSKNHLACFRPRNTVHIQSPPSTNAVSVVPYCPHQQGLRSLTEVVGNPHPRLRMNVPKIQAHQRYRLGLVTTSKALNSIMRPCGPGKMPASAERNLGNNISTTGLPIGKREAMRNSDAQGMHAY